MHGTGVNITGGIEPVHILLAQVSASFFEVMGRQPAIGRPFLPQEDIPNGPAVAVISSRLWRRQFHSDAGILDHAIFINGSRYTIVGVLPPRFDYPSGADIWTPTIDSVLKHQHTGAIGFRLIARMKSRATLNEVIAQQKSLFGKEYGFGKDGDFSVNGVHITQLPIAQSLHRELSAQQDQPVLLLAGAAGIVLLIACANIANLSLARLVTRGREFAIRRALGVANTRLLQQILTEQVLLGLLGGVAGLCMAYGSLPWLRELLPEDWPSYASVGIDKTVLTFALMLSFGVGLLTAAAPSLRVFRNRVRFPEFLSGGGRISENVRQRHWRYCLVLIETALAMLLLAIAGWLVQGLVNLAGVHPGFHPNDVLTVSVTHTNVDAGKKTSTQTFYAEVGDRLRAMPGVLGVSGIDFLPARREGVMMFIDVRTAQMPNAEGATPRIIMPDYFRVMRIPLLGGRGFSRRDTAASERVAIISDQLAKELWPGGDPVGSHL